MGFLRYVLTFVLVATLAHDGLSELKLGTNPSASLKPLNRIEGTNLFTNTVYKWHDNMLPGCYVTYLTENSNTMTVCNYEDQKFYDNKLSEWIIEQNSDNAQFKAYEFRMSTDLIDFINYCRKENKLRLCFGNPRYPRVLNHNAEDKSNRLISSLTGGRPVFPLSAPFYFKANSSNKNDLQIVDYLEDKYVVPDPAGYHRSFLILQDEVPADFRYSFVPAIKTQVKMFNFQFTRPLAEELSQHTNRKGLIDTYTIMNNSPSTLSRRVTVSEKVTNEFAWGMSEKFAYGTKITAKAGIPFLAETEIETGIELEVASNQDWTNSVEKSFEMSYEVQVPPNSQVEISAWYDLIKDIKLDYTAMVEITGTTSRVSVFYDLVADAPASGEMIQSHLDYSKFDGTIIEVKDDRVIAQLKGTMTASVGVRGQLSVNGDTVTHNT